MTKEIEKEQTYLLETLPADLTEYNLEYTKDTYYPPQNNNPQIRLRQRGDHFFLTKKYPKVEGDLSTMIEETIHLSKLEFEFLDKSLEGKSIEKNRYSRKTGDLIIEIDEYLGQLNPLKVLDIEWESEKPTDAILGLFKIQKEITQVKELAAGKLAGKSYDEIKQHI